MFIGSEGSNIAGAWIEPGIFYLLSNLRKGSKVQPEIESRDCLLQADSAWPKT